MTVKEVEKALLNRAMELGLPQAFWSIRFNRLRYAPAGRPAPDDGGVAGWAMGRAADTWIITFWEQADGKQYTAERSTLEDAFAALFVPPPEPAAETDVDTQL